jgi:AcrR family transcriptional regulator
MSKPRRIVEAAAARFRHYGIAKTTMQEIAADAGVSVGTLYVYFKNKDDLVAACVQQFAAQHVAKSEAILAADLPADEKLRQYVLARFLAAEDVRTSTPHAKELVRAVLRVKPERLREEADMMFETVTRILQQGVDSRLFQIASIPDDAKVFLYAIAYFFPNALNEPPISPQKEDLLSIVHWFIRAWRRAPRAGRIGSRARNLRARVRRADR